MSNFTAVWLGVKEFTSALEKIAAEYDTTTRTALIAAATEVETAAKNNFDGSHKPGEPHVGGSKPNVVTGTLRRSITFDPPHRDGVASYSTSVAPHTIYARRVELGYPGGKGRGHGHTRAFPYFEPAVNATRDAVFAAYVKALRG